MHTLVFVYGEMRVGRTLHRVLKRAVPLGVARTHPSYGLFDMDEFPAMVAGGTTAVTGELWRANRRTLDAIDALEGHPEFFVRDEVRLEDGRTALAWLLHPHRREWATACVDSGDWLADANRQTSGALVAGRGGDAAPTATKLRDRTPLERPVRPPVVRRHLVHGLG
jgi:gamma-glutamylaminecyclotransferase